MGGSGCFLTAPWSHVERVTLARILYEVATLIRFVSAGEMMPLGHMGHTPVRYPGRMAMEVWCTLLSLLLGQFKRKFFFYSSAQQLRQLPQ